MTTTPEIHELSDLVEELGELLDDLDDHLDPEAAAQLLSLALQLAGELEELLELPVDARRRPSTPVDAGEASRRAQLLELTRVVLQSLGDGRVTPLEAVLVLRTSLPFVQDLVEGLHHLFQRRTAAELLVRASELEQRGRDKRAARLRRRAARRTAE